MERLSAPKAVIFDWDNTLVNTWPIIHKALVETFNHYGLEAWTLEETRRRVKHSLRDSFPKLFGEKWEEAGKYYQKSYQSCHLQELESLPETEAVLKFLQEKGVYTVVVSNKKGPNLRKEVEHIGWNPYFRTLVGSDDAANDKPHADPVTMALAGSGIEAGADVWFVGDTTIDLECAKNTGCVPVLYGEIEGEPVNGELEGFAVRHHTRSHSDLLKLFQQVL